MWNNVIELGVGVWNKTHQVFTCKQTKHSIKMQSGSIDRLTLMDWEKLQPADSLQTAQDYAWNSGWFYTVVPLAAAWHLFKMNTTKQNKNLSFASTSSQWNGCYTHDRWKCLYFSPWKCRDSWPAWPAAAPVHLPPVHRYPGCPWVLWKTHRGSVKLRKFD